MAMRKASKIKQWRFINYPLNLRILKLFISLLICLYYINEEMKHHDETSETSTSPDINDLKKHAKKF